MKQNKKNFKFSRENFNFSKIKKSSLEFFLGHSELLFMAFFVIMAISSSILIYKYIYSSVWSDQKKEAYLQELRNGEVDFNLNNFNLIVEKSKERELLYGGEVFKEVRDIFGIEK